MENCIENHILLPLFIQAFFLLFLSFNVFFWLLNDSWNNFYATDSHLNT